MFFFWGGGLPFLCLKEFWANSYISLVCLSLSLLNLIEEPVGERDVCCGFFRRIPSGFVFCGLSVPERRCTAIQQERRGL